MSFRRFAAGAVGSCVVLAGIAWCADRALPFPFEKLERPLSRVVTDRNGEPLRYFLAADDRWRFPLSAEQLPEHVRDAVIASEDRWFTWHPGVNPLAILRAALGNTLSGRRVSGASTIPMQLARLVDPRPRTLHSKILEAFRALQLDWHLSKSEILKHYLELAPFGGNIEGLGAAARLYFAKPPEELALGELALLIALPRAPSAYDPIRHPEAARAARDRVLAQLVERGGIGPASARDATAHALPSRLASRPFLAPHLTRDLAAEHFAEATIRSSIDRGMQARVEAQVRSHIDGLRQRGIGNAAAVVVHVPTRQVLALVGSAGFEESAHLGQVNGAVAERSPGSLLKPFLYGRAMDLGMVVPDSYLLDVPTDFSGYLPENYDGEHRGRVTVREALATSLNTPAVRLLSRVGLGDFVGWLREGELPTLRRNAASYGLPFILGSAELRLTDLTNLYATLADGGRHKPLRWIASGEIPEGREMLSPEAAYLVEEMLRDVERPDLPDTWRLTRDAPEIAWKTGTSYGHRDAWAVGFADDLATGVWVGRFDGRGVAGISGAKHAGPLLFDLFRTLPRAARSGPKPDSIRHTTVCALSHQRATDACRHRTSIVALPNTELRRCDLHRWAFLDSKTGERLDGACIHERPHQRHALVEYPPSLLAWRAQQGLPLPAMPSRSRLCNAEVADGGLRITSPDPRTAYFIQSGVPRENQRIPLIAQCPSAACGVTWYVSGRRVSSGRSNSGHAFTPLPGIHRVLAVSDDGRRDEVTIRVESP